MIVCMSRRICVDLYDADRPATPAWHDNDDDGGRSKVVMTGGGKRPSRWQTPRPQQAASQSDSPSGSDPTDPLKLVIVRDMWLTGFDAPSAAHDVRGQADAWARA